MEEELDYEWDTQRQMKQCEQFCSKMRKNNPSLFRQLASLVLDYASNQQTNYYYDKLSVLMREDPSMIHDINKMLLSDVKIQVKVEEPPKKKVAEEILIDNKEFRQEAILFEKIKYKLSEQDFSDFIKAVHLFSDAVLTLHEILQMCQVFDKDIYDELKAMLTQRNLARRKDTNIFKPLKDTDFKNSSRVSRSYVHVHSGYARSVTGFTPVLNHTWVSVPFGSEDYSFVIMRKNTFEEQLFKSEDERFDFDLELTQMRLLQKYLKKVIEGDVSLVRKCVEMKVIQQLYKNDHEEVVGHFQANPSQAGKIILKRVEQKHQEIQVARNTKARPLWETVSQSNFHRSLDHRSFYFKKNDKLLTTAQRFLKESEERMLASKTDYDLLQEYYNSLSLLTTIKPVFPQKAVAQLPTPQLGNLACFPIYNFYFDDIPVLEECLKYTIHYMQIMTGISQQEKKAGIKTLVQVTQALFQQGISSIDMSQLVTSEGQLMQEVYEMENTIYDVTFSYYQNLDCEESKHATGKKGPNKQDSATEEGAHEEIHRQDNFQKSKQEYPTTKFEGKSTLPFFPKQESNFLYVNSGLYVVMRYLYTIYQRMILGKQMSSQFEQNNKTRSLTEEQKQSITLKRYQLFRSILLLSFKSKEFKYEDYLRSVFGNQGFLFSTLEKLLHDLCKHLGQISSEFVTRHVLAEQISANDFDDASDESYPLIFKCLNTSEEQALAQIYLAVLEKGSDKPVDKQIYRLQYVENTLFIHLLPSTTGVHDKAQLYKSSTYTMDYTQNWNTRMGHKGIYLQRNKKSVEAELVWVENQIDWGVGDYQKLHLTNIIQYVAKEDVLVNRRRKSKVAAEKLIERARKAREVVEK